MAFTPTIIKTWRYTTAQTDTVLETVSSTQRMVPIDVTVNAAGSNTVTVAVSLALHASAMPTLTPDSATGAVGMFFSHPGVLPGSGPGKTNGGESLCVGDVDADLRLKSGVATGGYIDISVQYRLLEDQ